MCMQEWKSSGGHLWDLYISVQDFSFSYMIPVTGYSFYKARRFGNRQAL